MKQLSIRQRLTFLAILGTLLGMAFLPEMALAGTGGTEFSDIYTLLSGWAKGTLGKVIALAIFMVGIVAGVVQQSLTAAVVGIGGALIMYYGPTVIENIVSALI